MAFVVSDNWNVTYTFRDNNGKNGFTSVYFAGALTDAEILLAAGNLATELQDASNAVLTGYTITRVVVQDAPAVPPAESEVERKLRIQLHAGAIRNATSLEVPSPIFGFEIEGTDVVNPAAPAWISLRDMLLQGTLGAENGVTTSRGEPITAAEVPVIIHRNRAPKR